MFSLHLDGGLQTFIFQVEAAALLDNLHRVEYLRLVGLFERFELLSEVDHQVGGIILPIIKLKAVLGEILLISLFFLSK